MICDMIRGIANESSLVLVATCASLVVAPLLHYPDILAIYIYPIII